jgi:hypothetical protein
MNKEEYVVATDETAIYPEAGTGSVGEIMYLTLGLIGELGELKKAGQAPYEIKAEAGDCYWYLLRLLRIFDEDTIKEQPGICERVYNWAKAPVAECTDELTAALANHVKKLWRDKLTDERRLRIWLVLKDIEAKLDKKVRILGRQGKAAVLSSNIDKLLSRKERNVLGGDGDNR